MKRPSSNIIKRAFWLSLIALVGITIYQSLQTFGQFSLQYMLQIHIELPQFWMLDTIPFSIGLLMYFSERYNKSFHDTNFSSNISIRYLTLFWGVAIYAVSTLALVKFDKGILQFKDIMDYHIHHPVVYGLISLIPFSLLLGLIVERMLEAEKDNQRISQKLKDQNGILQQQVEEVENNKQELIEAKYEALAGVKAKDQFLSNMSHEIRTPMNGIIGLLNLIAETPLNEEQKDYISAIQASSKNLMTLIDQILDLSKINSEKLTLEFVDFNLHETISNAERTFKGLAQEKSIEIRTIIHANVPQYACGDPVRISQIFMNLVGNAIKFTSEGGVDIIIKSSSTDDGPRLQCEVNDTGIGIPKDKHDYIFESFSQANMDTTRQFGGSGLGLAISKELVELFGGQIKVESELGKGTSFSFELQLKKANKSPSSEIVVKKHKYSFDPSKIKILVAEDNKINQMVALKILKKIGFDADIVNNGQEVINQVFIKQYDIILMDVRMPIMSGLDATRFIRNATEPPLSNIPIIALSASTMPDEIKQCMEVGMNGHVAKPFKAEALMESLEKHLSSSTLNP